MSKVPNNRPPRKSGEVIAWPDPRDLIAAQKGVVLPRDTERGLSVVGLRVDALKIAAVVELDRQRLTAWQFCAVSELPEEGAGGPERAGDPGVVRLWLDGWGGGLKSVDLAVRPLRGDRWFFQNADVRGIVDEHPIAGCQLEVTFTQAFLATNTINAAIAYVRAIGASLGLVRELRTRRLDLAADVAGWEIRPQDREGWIKPGRAGVAGWVELPDDGDPVQLREYGVQKVTGYTVAPGGVVLARNYNKRIELDRRSPEKKQGEESIWKSNGWDGLMPVARLEFQLQSEALKSFGIVDPADIERALDPLWQYLTNHWCRLVVPGTASRLSRCDVDPRWALLRRIQFAHSSLPAARRYMRGGATAPQVVGNLISFVANRSDKEGVTFIYLPPAAPESEAQKALEISVMRWMAAGGRAVCDQLVALLGTARAAVDYLNATGARHLARASTVGGGAVPPEIREEAPRERKRRPAVLLWAS